MSKTHFYFPKYKGVYNNVENCNNYILQRVIIKMKIIENISNVAVHVKWREYYISLLSMELCKWWQC